MRALELPGGDRRSSPSPSRRRSKRTGNQRAMRRLCCCRCRCCTQRGGGGGGGGGGGEGHLGRGTTRRRKNGDVESKRERRSMTISKLESKKKNSKEKNSDGYPGLPPRLHGQARRGPGPALARVRRARQGHRRVPLQGRGGRHRGRRGRDAQAAPDVDGLLRLRQRQLGAPVRPRPEGVPRQARVHRHARARRVMGLRQGAAGVQRHQPGDEEGESLGERKEGKRKQSIDFFPTFFDLLFALSFSLLFSPSSPKRNKTKQNPLSLRPRTSRAPSFSTRGPTSSSCSSTRSAATWPRTTSSSRRRRSPPSPRSPGRTRPRRCCQGSWRVWGTRSPW